MSLTASEKSARQARYGYTLAADGESIKVADTGGATALATLHTDLGGNADAIVAAGAAGSISAKLRRLTQGVEDLKTQIVLATGGRFVRDEFSRPNDAIPYGAADAIGATVSDSATTALRSLDLARAAGKPFWLTYLRLMVNHTTFLSRIRVHFYTVANPGASGGTAIVGDNVPMPILFANRALRLGSVELPPLALMGSGSDCVIAVRDNDLRVEMQPDAADSKVYYRLESIDGGTPDALKTFHLTAGVQDI